MMQLTGGIIVIIAFAAIIRKYETRTVLLVAGALMCFIGGVMGQFMDSFVKTMIHGSLVPTICTVMGFAFVMKHTECDQHLVHALSGLISKSHAIIIPLAMLVTWWLNIAVTSAAGAAILAGTWGSAISPGNTHVAFISKMANVDVMFVVLETALPAIIASLVVAVSLTLVAAFRKEGPSKARQEALAEQGTASIVSKFKVNGLKAMAPIVPLVILVVTNLNIAALKDMGIAKVSVPAAMIIGCVVALIIARAHALEEVTKDFFKGMGDAYGSIIGLIIAAAVFTKGMQAMGLTDALLTYMKDSQSFAKIAGSFGPFIIAILSGSGDAAALAFNGAITPHAASFGMNMVDLGSLAQISGAIGRSTSPVAGAAIICASLANVGPMELAKRNIVPMLVGVITFLILF
ncbi:C4-dicarboxylate transporter DcuC [Veillonella sp. LMAG:2]|uniref:C4-dicarboxylate transporter DcuC n=1 Tax=Veillonella sp. LMAG:2 TaxID=1969164 RepID=UPI0025DEF03E|nr:C4-dicarboxylate transporter DcuC [Veillonella sp. LMAG:2]